MTSFHPRKATSSLSFCPASKAMGCEPENGCPTNQEPNARPQFSRTASFSDGEGQGCGVRDSDSPKSICGERHCLLWRKGCPSFSTTVAWLIRPFPVFTILIAIALTANRTCVNVIGTQSEITLRIGVDRIVPRYCQLVKIAAVGPESLDT